MYPVLPGRVRLIWYLGFVLRYFFLFPVRALLLAASLLGLCVGALYVGARRDCSFSCDLRPLINEYDEHAGSEEERRQFCEWLMVKSFRLAGKSLSLLTRYHNPENRVRYFCLVKA